MKKTIEFVQADIQGCLCGGVNIGFALLLSAWTEYFGHCLTNERGGSCAYDAWLRYMGQEYSAILDSNVDLYDRVRCGSIHEFAIKGGANIFTCDNHPGIEIIDDKILFNNKQYANDFNKAIEKYLNALQTDEALRRRLQGWLTRKSIVVV